MSSLAIAQALVVSSNQEQSYLQNVELPQLLKSVLSFKAPPSDCQRFTQPAVARADLECLEIERMDILEQKLLEFVALQREVVGFPLFGFRR